MKISKKITIFAVMLLMTFILNGCKEKKEFKLDPKKINTSAKISTEDDAAVGWSKNDDYTTAIKEAVAAARKGLNGKTPNFAHVIYISEENHDEIISEIRKEIGPGVKIYGATSNTIITNDGIITADKFAVGVLLVASDGITYGIGALDLNSVKSPEDAGREAITEALNDVKKNKNDKPDIILYMGTTKRGEENQIMKGIADIVGKDLPVVGGNAKDFGSKFANNWRQFTGKETFDNGLILVAVYANKVGWGFESTFKLTDKKGIVTKSDGFRIAEIDGRPALDVYNEWVEGEFYERLNAGEFNSAEEKVDFNLVKKFTLSNPIAKIVKGDDGEIGHFSTSPIPDEQDIRDKTLTVYAQVSTDDEISLYRGTWQTTMNRVENIPNNALLRSGIQKGDGSFAVMVFCNGLKTILPPEEFAKIPAITNEVLGGVPFLGAITAGEQGPIPGIGNINANIIESVVLFK